MAAQVLTYNYAAPSGLLRLVSDGSRLLECRWTDDSQSISDAPDEVLTGAIEWLDRYFDGQVSPLPEGCSLPDGTPFQQQVWQAAINIPYAATATYRDIAVAIGHPKAVRAVGTALGRNPLHILIPCHRVIATTGRLTGYAGGLERKTMLLELERSNSNLHNTRN